MKDKDKDPMTEEVPGTREKDEGDLSVENAGPDQPDDSYPGIEEDPSPREDDTEVSGDMSSTGRKHKADKHGGKPLKRLSQKALLDRLDEKNRMLMRKKQANME